MQVKSVTTDEPAGEVLDEWTLKAGEAREPDRPDEPNPCLGTP